MKPEGHNRRSFTASGWGPVRGRPEGQPQTSPRLDTRCGAPAPAAQPLEPILFPKLRIYLADFPYRTLFYRLEAAHLGNLMRL